MERSNNIDPSVRIHPTSSTRQRVNLTRDSRLHPSNGGAGCQIDTALQNVASTSCPEDSLSDASSLSGQVVSFFSDVHRQEDGKLTLVATIMMLGMVVLIGLIGNAGHTVNQKIETQNAADAAAFSSALWMARGMNALTATNHMLGEATALCAVHEALGGPGMDLGIKENTAENQYLDAFITVTRETAPIGELVPPAAIYVPAPVHNIDKQIVKFVTNRTTPNGDKRFKAFATIFDSKMTLKRDLNKQLLAKTIADIGFYMPWPINLGSVPAAYIAHGIATVQIVLIGKEWVILDVLEVVAKLFTPLKRNIIEQQLIPTLAAHANFVASYDTESKEFEAGILNSAVERTLTELSDRHSAELATYPAADELRLPVEAEPEPNLNGGPNVPEWGKDNQALIDASGIGDLLRKQDEAVAELNDRINELENEIDSLDKFDDEIDERLQDDDVSDDERRELQEEKQDIAAERTKLNGYLNESKESRKKVLDEKASLPSDGPPPRSSHPGVKRIPQRMTQSQERYTQWVRASQPYTDSFRAPILAMFKRHLKKSKAAEHYEKWSNRYTMVKAWQFRSGYRLRKSGNSASWSKQDKPLHMLVMKDSFDGERSRKGSEPWTNSSTDGKLKAEEYFTLIAFAHREFEPLFSTVVYPAVNDKGITSFGQAIFYNGNEQRTPNGGGVQTKIGWDTLNWDPKTDVPEWAGPASQSNAKWPWDVFSSADQKAKVKLNWQPKLMPVTDTRLSDSDEDLSGNMADNVGHAIEYFEELGTH